MSSLMNFYSILTFVSLKLVAVGKQKTVLSKVYYSFGNSSITSTILGLLGLSLNLTE